MGKRTTGGGTEPTAPRHIVAVAALVRDAAGHVLLVQNDRGWEMPGGQVELGEDLPAALRREVKEEAGCDVAVNRVFGIYSNLSSNLVVVAFHCAYVGGPIRGGAECLDARWFEPDRAASAADHAPAADRIRDGLAAAPGVVYRSYERTMDGRFHVSVERSI